MRQMWILKNVHRNTKFELSVIRSVHGGPIVEYFTKKQAGTHLWAKSML